MRQTARIALTAAAFFLLIVAIMLNSTALFYMATAVIATIAASHLQAYLSVRGLHFERHAPQHARVGELVAVDITVWSDRRIRRPLVSVFDQLPPRLVYSDRTPSLPIAPAFDIPIQSQYMFRPQRRGVYRWSGLRVLGTDALGLVTKERVYDSSPVEMMVVPNAIRVDFDIPPAPAYGISESELGQGRGSGIEPRGVREYAAGDSLRYVHWRSSARRGKLLVKEFATGSYAITCFVLQRTRGTEIGVGASTTLEQMCANAAYMAELIVGQGGEICFPTHQSSSHGFQDHGQQVLATLAAIEPDSKLSISEEIAEARRTLPAGGLIFAFLGVADPGLPEEVKRCLHSGIQVVAMVYDAAGYLPPRSKETVHSASAPSFTEELQSAGARVHVVPKPASL